MEDLVFCDAWVVIISHLNLSEIAITRRVCKTWLVEGKKRVAIYDINGWSQWDRCEDKLNWNMLISVANGKVSGMNKNDEENGRIKIYSGTCVNKTFKVNVLFPSSSQENYYEGSVKDGIFRGRFTLTKKVAVKDEGAGGVIEGVVNEL